MACDDKCHNPNCPVGDDHFCHLLGCSNSRVVVHGDVTRPGVLAYLIQISVMIGDLVLIAMSVMAIVLLGFFGVILAAGALAVWHRNGAFEAWHPHTVRKFFFNARKIGL